MIGKIFLIAFAVLCLGLAVGIPSPEMFSQALQQQGHHQSILGGLVIAAVLLMPLLGFVALVKGYVRFWRKFHQRMSKHGIWTRFE